MTLRIAACLLFAAALPSFATTTFTVTTAEVLVSPGTAMGSTPSVDVLPEADGVIGFKTHGSAIACNGVFDSGGACTGDTGLPYQSIIFNFVGVYSGTQEPGTAPAIHYDFAAETSNGSDINYDVYFSMIGNAVSASGKITGGSGTVDETVYLTEYPSGNPNGVFQFSLSLNYVATPGSTLSLTVPDHSFSLFGASTADVPEPGTLALMTIGLALCVARRLSR